MQEKAKTVPQEGKKGRRERNRNVLYRTAEEKLFE